MYIHSLNLTELYGQKLFTDEHTGAQNGDITYPEPQGKLAKERDFKP